MPLESDCTADSVAGLLPPPLTATSAELARDPAYEYHIARLNQLALMSNVYLKVLPPVVLKCDADEWVQDAKELQRVLRMYRKSCCNLDPVDLVLA